MYPCHGGENGTQLQNTDSKVIINRPLKNQVIYNKDTITITAQAYDIDNSKDIKYVKFYYDGDLTESIKTLPFVMTLSSHNGTNKIKAITEYAGGKTDTPTIKIQYKID